MMKYALILAGGSGTRLWPISTEKTPKQFLNLYGKEIMINETIKRMENIFNYDNIFIIINRKQSELAHRYIDNRIPRENIIVEAESKGTAMCIFYSTLKIKKLKGDGIITVLSSDHYIEQEEELVKSIKDANKIAEYNGGLVTIGIKPTYPSVQFGYIKYESNMQKNYYSVTNFKEKPNHERAIEYFNDDCHVWNSGIFIWKIESILENFKNYLPNVYNFKEKMYLAINTNEEDQIVKDIYSKVKKISIDKGILEKSNNVKMIKCNFKWLDIGNINDFFDVYSNDSQNNIIVGDSVIIKDTNNTNILNRGNNLFIIVGLDNVNILNDNDVCVICNNEKISDLSQILQQIKNDDTYRKYM